MSDNDRWSPVRPVRAPNTPNIESVTRGIQRAANAEAVREARGRTGHDIGSGWGFVERRHPVVPGWLYEGTVNPLTAPSGGAKSFVCLDVATAVARGDEWNGVELERRPVVVLGAEHASTWHDRYETWCDVNNGGAKLPGFEIVNERSSKECVSDPEMFLHELASRRLAHALIILDTVGAAVENLGNTNNATTFLRRMERVAHENESAILFTNHELLDGKQRGSQVLHTDTGNRLRCGMLPDGNVELSTDRDRYGTNGQPPAVRYQLNHTADGREYVSRIGQGAFPESQLRSEVLNYLALTGKPLTGRAVSCGTGLPAGIVGPELAALVHVGAIVETPDGFVVS